jgi:hypothetical protein
MFLSAEQFKQILSSLKSDEAPRGSMEKRSAPRAGLRTKLTVYRDGNIKDAHTVWVRDLSANGIGIVNSAPLEKGSHFLIRYPLRNGDNLSAFYTVMHCKDLSKTLFFVGARLDRIIE